MSSFLNTVESGGYSSAAKTKDDANISVSGGYNAGVAAFEGETSGGNHKSDESKSTYANDDRFLEEEQIKLKQALVSILIFMPMRSYTLSAVNMMLSDHAIFEIRKFSKQYLCAIFETHF